MLPCACFVSGLTVLLLIGELPGAARLSGRCTSSHPARGLPCNGSGSKVCMLLLPCEAVVLGGGPLGADQVLGVEP